MKEMRDLNELTGLEIAVIGMHGRFPGASTINQFWQNLCQGVESITWFTPQALAEAGVAPNLITHPDYVPASAVLEDIDKFDAAFFGYNPREASIIDPQHRILLEEAWWALEAAGYNPETYPGLIGIYAGVGLSNYLLHVYSHPELSQFLTLLGNDKDFLTTRISYKLNLKGPSVNVQSACSTSLVAIHLACQSLLGGECDLALAGGATVRVPHDAGYLYQEGGILSADGHCRAFDVQAQGTVPGNGAAMVVLKRLEDAMHDGDHIEAVIKGTAINNDGSYKIGFTAPSIDGQTAVIKATQLLAEVEPNTIGYIETHGTGTALGDPIEIKALAQAFATADDVHCVLGSVKTNIGHLDTAAGVTGFIKTVLAVQHGRIPPSLHYHTANPQLDLDQTGFSVNTELTEWPQQHPVRRAAVSSFGLGGTNAHVILEQAPPLPPTSSSRQWQLLPLSAVTDTALTHITGDLANHLQENANLPLADVAYTLQLGRKPFLRRRIVLCTNHEQAIDALTAPNSEYMVDSAVAFQERPLYFMFSGQGSQYVNMARDLYTQESVFRKQVDQCALLLQDILGIDLRDILYPLPEKEAAQAERLQQTAITQPTIFTIEYALAKLWSSWGIEPDAMIGHSIGEYVAACLAGVLTLPDALKLVAIRGRLMQTLPPGAMLSVPMSAEELEPLLTGNLSLAAINAHHLSVVSGPSEEIDQLAIYLTEADIQTQRLHTSHAFHSAMMDPILAVFIAEVDKLSLQPPLIPFISNVTGSWITADEATDPTYWGTHLRHAVRFADGLSNLLVESGAIFLEVGPGRTLSSLAKQHHAYTHDHIILTTLRHPREQTSDQAYMLKTLGRLWLAGHEIDWSLLYTQENRRRVTLPVYPFERQSYWIEMQEHAYQSSRLLTNGKQPLQNWFYLPAWERTIPSRVGSEKPALPSRKCWLLLLDQTGIAAQLGSHLQQMGQTVIFVGSAHQFQFIRENKYNINPQNPADYTQLLLHLIQNDLLPNTIIHLAQLAPQTDSPASARGGYDSLLYLAQAIMQNNLSSPLHIDLVTTQTYDVVGSEPIRPEQAVAVGLLKVIAQEQPQITYRCIDLPALTTATTRDKQWLKPLLAELLTETPGITVSYRGMQRWQQMATLLSFRPDAVKTGQARIQQNGVYLLINGLDGPGLTFAKQLQNKHQVSLCFIEPDDFPVPDQWEQWLATHESQNPVSRKIRSAQLLHNEEACVLVLPVNSCDKACIRGSLSEIAQQLGTVQGVIYTAIVDAEETINNIDLDIYECTKRQHSLALNQWHDVLAESQVDFCLLLSSMASFLGGLKSAIAAGVYAQLDAWARQTHHTTNVPWQCINCDAWEDSLGRNSEIQQQAITAEEMGELFWYVLSAPGLEQILISTTDLPTRVAQWLTKQRISTDGQEVKNAISHYERPRDLSTVYVAPRNDLEQIVTNCWQEVMGIDQIGVHDNFYELGGHSLLATQVAARLREVFPIDLPLDRLFSAQTVAELMVVITQELAQQTEMETLHQLLDALEYSVT